MSVTETISGSGQIWTKKDFQTQIQLLENQLSIVLKVSKVDLGENITNLTSRLTGIYKNFEENKLSDVEQNIIDVKAQIYKIVNGMGWMERIAYNVSLWGISPIGLAIIAMIISFSLIVYRGSFVILDVPLWASFIAVIGASVQILIGVVNDYKDDCKITEYKRLWYIVLPFVSFVFGFLAFLLTNAGLFSLTSGQITTNQSISMAAISGLPSGLTGGSIINPPAILIIICFLAGYATDWFMGLLLKYTHQN